MLSATPDYGDFENGLVSQSTTSTSTEELFSPPLMTTSCRGVRLLVVPFDLAAIYNSYEVSGTLVSVRPCTYSSRGKRGKTGAL